MIWKKIMPSGGGGALRRFIRLRQDLINNKFPSINPLQSSASRTNIDNDTAGSSSSEKSSMNQEIEGEDNDEDDSKRIAMQPLSLFDFYRNDDAVDAKAAQFGSSKGGWRLSDDGVIGGYSSGSAVFLDPFSQHSNDSNDINVDKNKNGAIPFIRWNGNIDTKIGKNSRVKRSGFCAIRSPDCSLPPFSYGVPFNENYNALEIRCRTDGRMYTVNLKVSTYMEDDLYQSFISVKPVDLPPSVNGNVGDNIDDALSKGISSASSDWITVIMPFRDFVLTSGGRQREQQRDLDGAITFQHLGFTLMDEADGPFQFDIGRIRAVNYDDGKILNDV